MKSGALAYMLLVIPHPTVTLQNIVPRASVSWHRTARDCFAASAKLYGAMPDAAILCVRVDGGKR